MSTEADHPLRVVVAEDSFLLRAEVVRVLEDTGFVVVGEARDAQELLDQVREHRPDVVITDIRMPPTHTDEGVRAAAVIRREEPQTGVVVLPIRQRELCDSAVRSDRRGYRLHDRGFDGVDGEEWSAWLRRHGASADTIGATFEQRAPALRAVYDVACSFRGGDLERPDAAAGTATNDLVRLRFTYRGAIMYKMQAGMGNAIFAPLYAVLRLRGVRFRSFHAVIRLGVAGDGTTIESIEVLSQVGLRRKEYEPLVDVKSLPSWPSEPCWEQLESGAEVCGTRYEAELDPRAVGASEVLRHGVHFDKVVLAIPVGALEPICRRVADGGTALDPQVVAALLADPKEADRLRSLTPRERSVLELLAEGRSNKASGERLAITHGAVQKQVSTIFNKLGLPAGENDDRRILAVLTYVLPEP